MAKRVNKPQNTGTTAPHTFDKDLVEDITGKGLAPNVWTQARNATPNTTRGDLGELSNEQSNKFCAAAPYKIIGLIHIDEDKWAVFSTDNTDSEIGLFKEELCEYDTIVNDRCLNFSDLHLIKGQAKENYDCTFQLYWEDGNNPTRTLNIDEVPWIEICVDENNVTLPGPPGPPEYVPVGCVTCTPTEELDCDAIRLAPLVKNPCFNVEQGPQGGELLNGSYFAVGAYVVNGQRFTDYSMPSNVQALFDHSGIAGSLDITVTDIDTSFDEFELVIVEIRNLKPLAKKIGIYNTRQKRISIDAIDDRYPTIDIPDIAIRNAVVDKADAIFRNGDYLIRTGPTNKFDFNYQPLANQIDTEWISVEYPADYYRKGGNVTNYMRDEVYSFFIRWVYNTGDKSPSFHIPGRYEPPTSSVFGPGPSGDTLPGEAAAGINQEWRVLNTAFPTSGVTAISLPDGGVQISKGKMAYWESSERYDDDNPDVWDASSNPIWGSTNPAHDLCGKQIRHHRFPDNTKGWDGSSWVTNHHNDGGSRIRVMGVQFSNIKPPLDNDGNPIENIVGYEILRGTREGNKSITAKGIINNMRTYVISGGITPRFGLYPNYPYNPTLLADRFIDAPGSFASRRHFTFHSPDTNFRDPFLSAREIVNYGEARGTVNGKFEYPDGHPEHQLITNFAFFVALIGGIGFALIKKNGSRTTQKVEPQMFHSGLSIFGTLLGGYATGSVYGAAPATAAGGSPVGTPTLQSAIQGPMSAAGSAYDAGAGFNFKQSIGGHILDALGGTGGSGWFGIINGKNSALQTAGSFGGMLGRYTIEGVEGGDDRQMPTILNLIAGGLSFAMAASEGAEVVIRLIKALTPTEQYALQYQSHCLYDNFSVAPTAGNRRRSINEIQYLDADIQDMGTQWRINNLYRGRSVALETNADYSYTSQFDNTQQTVSTAPVTHEEPTANPFATTAVSYYTALKQRIRNQYGQLEGIIQVPVSTCMTEVDVNNSEPTVSEVLFGGDTYIGRYTEKNTMFFFYNWLNGQPDESEFDYQDYEMIPRPRYWMDTYEFDINEWLGEVANPATLLSGGPSWPSDKHELDCGSQGGIVGWLIKKNCFMYLFNSGVRDFFVESEVNIELRDWGDEDSQRHYDPYRFTDVNALFNTGVIKSGNYYKYDYSLSLARLYTNVTSWGNTHRRSYDPNKAEDCFVYRPNRAIYSLRQDQEKIRDYWRVFLPNNFKDFKSRITAIKPVNKNGAMILFENESPVQFQGVDTLVTDQDTKLTIGDGGLFSEPLQNILNTDDSYEYGSCQNRLSVVNTASGVFWMSQNQGKIFQVQKGIKEISAFDNKWWLSTYLPYLLTKDFPDFELTDNPVAGIGCQTIYDNESQLIYFCKRDFFLRSDIEDTVTYVSGDDFLVNDRLPIKLGDPDYFRDASWTISYDPKTEGWIGYHDWHPNLLMPGKKNFLSVKNDGIWRHNDDCQSYCNFYGEDYPFEVEYAVITPQVVNTLRSVEYYMEAYKYSDNCYDRFHVLDFNFDEAVVYNSEQCSGLLRLNLSPKNNAPEILNYPNINPNFIDILYDKVEQKYRFNQFWDITADRGEFNPLAERAIWDTEPNGYIRNLNPNNLNYNKVQTERKKFRHFKNTVLLRRRVCGNRNMLVSIANNKNLISPR